MCAAPTHQAAPIGPLTGTESVHPSWRCSLRQQHLLDGKRGVAAGLDATAFAVMLATARDLLPVPEDLNSLMRLTVAAVRRPYNSDQTLELGLAAIVQVLGRWQVDREDDPMFRELRALVLALGRERDLLP